MTEAAGTPGALARLVGDVEDFAARRWARQPLLRPAPAPTDVGFADLLTLDDVDELVSVRGLRTPFLRLVKDGRAIPESAYIGGGGTGATVPDQAHDDGIHEQMASGATLVLQGLHRLWPPLLGFGQELAADLGHPTQINAYITPAASRGFAAHYDVHDVFVLQLAAEKRWIVHEPVHPLPLAHQPSDRLAAAVAARAAQQPLLETVLRPGDCLYLPRGYLHSAQALGGLSAHLTIGVPAWPRHDLLDRVLHEVRAACAQDAALRDSLALGVDVGAAEELGEDLQAVRAALVRAVQGVSDRSVAARLDASARSAQRPSPIGPLAQLRAEAGLAAGDRMRLRAYLRPATRQREDGATELTGRFPTVLVPPSEQQALQAVLSGRSLVVPPDDAAPTTRLLGRLVRAGVVVPCRQER